MKTHYDIRIDGLDKVTGRAKYVGDLAFSGMLNAVAVHCPYPHARILSIDTEAANAVPGVAGIFTAKDFPGINQKPKSKPFLATDLVRYEGESVAIVAADSEETARRAAKLVKVTYQVLPAVQDPADALSENPSALVYEEGNLACEHYVCKGDLDEGFAKADLILERDFSTQRIHHSAMECDGVVAVPENHGLTLYAPCKNPYNIQNNVADAMHMPQNAIRVIQPVIGGYFGGKDADIIALAGRAALVAEKTGRPCRLVWNREEAMIESTKRHPFSLTYKVGAKKDGRITAIKVDGIADAGAYATNSLGVIWRASVESAGPYEIDNVRVHIRGAFTNNTYSDAVRGFGSPQVDFASESMMNELAEALNMSPWEIRYKNILHENSISITGQEMHAVSIEECLNELQKRFPLGEPEMTADGKYKARGMACLYRGESYGAASCFMADTAGSDVRVYADGSISIYTGVSEGGQGTHTAVAEVCAEVLGVPYERFHVEPVDTSYTPNGGATAGSRGTIVGCNAIRLAAEDLLHTFKDLINEEKNMNLSSLTGKDGILYDENGQEVMSFDEAVALGYKKGIRVEGHGQYIAPQTYWDFDKGQGKTYNSFSYGAAGAEVEIDPVTGKITLTDLICVHDIGRIVNQPEAEGQIAGGVVMASGYSLLEEIEYKGEQMYSTNYDRYLLPTTMDVPSVQAIPLAIKPAENPEGVHGVGEASTAIVAPAVAHAIARATGIHMRSIPFSLEKVRAALDAQRTE